jgi:threonine synthase
MRFQSRAGGPVSFREALFTGLAPDGGLYQPVERPELSRLFASFTDATPFVGLAASVAEALFAPEIDGPAAKKIAERSFSFQPVVRRLDDRLYLLELFHGPSCAFKDFAAQFLASSMELFLQAEHRRIQIVVATSGDTGSAVAQAFHNRENIDVVILYPSGRVTELQEKQLTTLGGNVRALEIEGSFDDCQRLAKEAFRDETLRQRLALTSANSINIGRLLPQCFYYVYALTRGQLRDGGPGAPVVCVPSGNFGNLTAGVFAWHWGLPVSRFIAATNINDEVPQYLSNGVFLPRPSEKTLSNAMDVGNPSNFERLLGIFRGDLSSIRRMIEGISVTDKETRSAMREVYEKFGLFVDPHTAVGYRAAKRYRGQGGEGAGARILVLSTAHPAKFLDIVRETIGAEPEVPERLARALALPKKSVRLGKDLEEFKKFLLDEFA